MTSNEFDEIVRKHDKKGEMTFSSTNVCAVFRLDSNLDKFASHDDIMQQSDRLELEATLLQKAVNLISPEVQLVTDIDMWNVYEYSDVKSLVIRYYVLFLEEV
jgi:predicted nucleotidyltransferase